MKQSARKISGKKYHHRTARKSLPSVYWFLLAGLFFAITWGGWRYLNRATEATVIKVVDGDTVILDDGTTVRYLGIDTPEISVPVTPIECFGPEATAKNRELVEGKQVKLIRDLKNKDKYGRILRYVYVNDQFINVELVAGGYARTLTVYPNVSYSREFISAEHHAQKSKIGLWSEEHCAGKK